MDIVKSIFIAFALIVCVIMMILMVLLAVLGVAELAISVFYELKRLRGKENNDENI